MGAMPQRAGYQRFVEDISGALERAGIPRIAGRIFGLLLLADASEVSTDELATGLKASRGSVSTMTRLLIQMGLVERVGKPGERRDYFRIKAGTWSNVLKSRMDQIIEFHDVIERGMALVTPKSDQAYRRLKEIHEFYLFFEREFPALFERWEQYSRNKGRS